MTLPQCAARLAIFDKAGDPAARRLVRVLHVELPDHPILLRPLITWTDAEGVVTLALPQGASCTIEARATVLEKGQLFTVPLAPEGELVPLGS